MHYRTNRRLVCASIASFKSEQERSLLRTLLAGGPWTALRGHQPGMITFECVHIANRPMKPNSTFCGNAQNGRQPRTYISPTPAPWRQKSQIYHRLTHGPRGLVP